MFSPPCNKTITLKIISDIAAILMSLFTGLTNKNHATNMELITMREQPSKPCLMYKNMIQFDKKNDYNVELTLDL